MDKEKTAQVSPEDSGLKSLTEKLDTVLQAAEEASAKAAEADARAKEAEKRAQEAIRLRHSTDNSKAVERL